MRKYWQILRKYGVNLAVSPVLVFISVLCETVQPMYMAKIVDNGVMQRDLSVIVQIGTYMILVSVAGLVVTILNVYISSRTSIGFGTDLRGNLFNRIQKLSFFDIDRFNPASLITRLTNDVSKVQHIIMMSMRMLLRAPLLLILAVFFVVRINTDLALVLLAAIPILGISIYFIFQKGFPLFIKIQQLVDRLNETVRENLINIRVVKSFVREEFETKKFIDKSEALRDMVVRASNLMVAIFPVMQLVMNLSIIAILWIGGQKVMVGELKVGELISFVNYLAQVLMALMFLSMIVIGFARASASSARILEVLNTEPSLFDTPEGLSATHRITEGGVEFVDVSFRYNGGDTDVLKDISFKVHPGETIAVVGATGAAKSSLVQLIPRLYDVVSGEIRIDGVPVKDYLLDRLHDQIGMVLQKNELFTGTIAENLRWGKEDATTDEMIEACQATQAHEFIMSFSNGYDTILGRGGINISGGQKQRICIARALLRKPKILILDDSTSAIDTETELKIRKNLHAMLHNTTVFIITQRIHTMQSADRIIVLDDGSISAIGTPEELRETSGLYQEICHSQQIVI